MRATESRELAARALEKGGPFNKSRVADLLEFGRILHAEMALVCTAARRGTALAGMTMYSTTYPCHECARLILGSGIRRLVYIDPYPKSLVPRMYAAEVSDGAGDPSTVTFEAFSGVAPRLFPSVFTMVGRDRDDVTGEYVAWMPDTAPPRLVDGAVLRYPVQTAEDEITKALVASFGSSGRESDNDEVA
jgi:cytidine deaminase